MRRAAVAAVAALLIAVTAAPAVGQVKSGPQSRVLNLPGKVNVGPRNLPVATGEAALSAAECRTLGGSVEDQDICLSGKSCHRKSQDGTWHAVCLSAATQ